jgi:hypothetical protein
LALIVHVVASSSGQLSMMAKAENSWAAATRIANNRYKEGEGEDKGCLMK